MTDYGHKAQQAAEHWLDELMAFDVDDEDQEPPVGGELFCGCITCIVRETLTAAYPELVTGIVALLREEGVVITEAAEMSVRD